MCNGDKSNCVSVLRCNTASIITILQKRMPKLTIHFQASPIEVALHLWLHGGLSSISDFPAQDPLDDGEGQHDQIEGERQQEA